MTDELWERLRAIDDEVIAAEAEGETDWARTVRVCIAVANGERPRRADCEALDLPYSTESDSDGFENVRVPGLGGPAPTRRQVQPLAEIVVGRLEAESGDGE